MRFYNRLYINKILLIFIIVIFINISGSRAQERREAELSAKEILAKVDNILRYPEGLAKGKMVHITSDRRSIDIKIAGFIAKENYIFKIIIVLMRLTAR